MTADFRVTPRAIDDLRAIGRYTLEQWGRTQRNAYLREIDRRFACLAEHPGFGRARPEIAPGYRSFAQGSHVIFYLGSRRRHRHHRRSPPGDGHPLLLQSGHSRLISRT